MNTEHGTDLTHALGAEGCDAAELTELLVRHCGGWCGIRADGWLGLGTSARDPVLCVRVADGGRAVIRAGPGWDDRSVLSLRARIAEALTQGPPRACQRVVFVSGPWRDGFVGMTRSN